jgi:hypothetical protein
VIVFSLKRIYSAIAARTAPAALAITFLLIANLSAAVGGSISGAVTDKAVRSSLAHCSKLVNTAQQTTYQATSDKLGLYSFPNLPVGHYQLTARATGFNPQRREDLKVDTDSAIRLDIALEIATHTDTVTVTTDAGVQVESAATHLGEVVSAVQMTALPLNGRSYTDLLAIQPGVTPVSTLLPSSVIMAGVTGSIDPSGDANPGNLSINGQRESANGFMVNGIDVQEHMNGGTSILPNLDSIEEFRVLTTNFDREPTITIPETVGNPKANEFTTNRKPRNDEALSEHFDRYGGILSFEVNR